MRKRIKLLPLFFLLIFTLLLGRLASIQLWFGRVLAQEAVMQRVQWIPLAPCRGEILDRHGVPLSGAYEEQTIVQVPPLAPLPVTMRRPYGERCLAAHVLGVWQETVEQTIGKSGLEVSFNHYLQGRDVPRVGVLRSAKGEPLSFYLQEADPLSPPYQVRTTLDAVLQQAMEDVLDRTVEKGAAVLMDATNGEILAMASRPNFHPGRLAEYINRNNGCFINRAVTPLPLGSVFKGVTLAALLEEGLADFTETFTCSGSIQVAGRAYQCHKEEGHGSLNLAQGFAESCNIVFITLGERIGGEKLREYALRFGFAQKTGIPLPEEGAGTLPAMGELNQRELANLAIGQGKLTASPVQICAFYAAVARGGLYHQPRLVQGVFSREGVELNSIKTERPRRIMKATTAWVIRDLMRQCVVAGTGRGADSETVQAAGKTGTAEVAGQKPHAWFAGFFPWDHPRYVLVVVVENGGTGSSVAAPIFRQIAEKVMEYAQP